MDRKFEQGIHNEGIEGVPQEVWENPADYEDALPLIKRTVSLVKQYGHTKPNKRDALLDQYAKPVARNPLQWSQLLENLNLISELKPDSNTEEIKALLFTRIETIAARRSSLPSWTPEKIEQLVKLGLDSKGELKGMIERTKVALFNAPQNTEEAIDLHYNAAWAMVTTIEPDIREELVSISCYEKEWLSELSLSAFYFTLGAGGLADDQHTKKYYAVIDARTAATNYTAMEKDGKMPLNSIRLQSLENRIQRATQLWPFVAGRERAEKLFALEAQNRIRHETIQTAFENDVIREQEKQAREDYKAGKRGDLSEATRALVKMNEERRNLSWPLTLKYDPDEPLRKIIDHLLGPVIGRSMWEQTWLSRGLSIITGSPIRLTDQFGILVAIQGL